MLLSLMRTNQGPSTATAAPAKATNVAPGAPFQPAAPVRGPRTRPRQPISARPAPRAAAVGISQPGTTPARTPAPSRHASETGSADVESLDTTTPATCPCRSPCSSTGPSTVLRTGYLDTRASDAQSMPRVSRRSGSRRSARARPAGRGRPISSTLSALTSYRAGGGLTGPRVANSSNSWRSPSRARLWARPAPGSVVSHFGRATATSRTLSARRQASSVSVGQGDPICVEPRPSERVAPRGQTRPAPPCSAPASPAPRSPSV